MSKSNIRCATDECVSSIKRWGDHYHSVSPVTNAPKFMPDAVAMCERCGGYTNGDSWKHVCKMCGNDVAAGKLLGFFVPHRCKECDEKVVAKEKADGKICRRCNRVYSYCCC